MNRKIIMGKLKILLCILGCVFASCNAAFSEDINESTVTKAVSEAGKLMSQGKYEEVIAVLNDSLPYFVEVGMSDSYIATIGIGYDNLGLSYMKLAKWDKAIIMLSRCKEFMPKWSAPYYLLGQAYCEYGVFEESIANFTKGIELDPNVADARDYDYLITSYVSINDKTNAEKVLDLAKQRFPEQMKDVIISELEAGLSKNKDINVYMSRAETCYQNKDYNGTIENYKKVIAIDPNHKIARYNLGKSLLMNGKSEEGTAECEKALSLGLDNINVYRTLGKEYLKKEDMAKALTMYQNIKRLDPNDDSAYFTCGMLYIWLKDGWKAREEFKKAVELNPNNIEAHYELGWLYADYESAYARKELEKVLELNPNHQRAKKELERLKNK